MSGSTILDEAAFATAPLLAAVTPSLASAKGSLILIGSAGGRSGFFFDAAAPDGKNAQDYFRMLIKHTDCPRMDPEFVEAERRLLGENAFAMEYCSEFRSDSANFFGADALRAIFQPDDELDAPPEHLPQDTTPIDVTSALQPTDDDVRAAMDSRIRPSSYLYE